MTTIQEESVKTGYSFYATGDQPLEVLKQVVQQYRDNGINHPIMTATRYELIAIPNGMNKERFMTEFNEFKAEAGTVYISIIELSSKQQVEQKYGPTGKIKTKNHIVKGARKWVTLHVVYRDERQSNELPQELFSAETKGEAMDWAREHANKTGESIYINLEKRLVGSSPLVAELTPEVKSYNEYTTVPDNTYLFFGKEVDPE